ncbi:hypothetical protein MNBD_IGNAVI01-385 [hydrothermal vent metagenome]|uniref:Schlafen AlbA-2 domain-containing protein n=1 Tax=hydrothermal vent metagenome TaxID=652676 RepID=A0A3B1CDH7_9ZZZZ
MPLKKFSFSKHSIAYLLTVVVILFLIGSIFFFDSQTIFTEQLIFSTVHEIEKELNGYLNPISKSLQKIREDGINDKININSEPSLNKYFIPLLKASKNISSIKYFDNSGHQYLLYKENKTFVSTFRIEKTFNNEVVWKRWKDVNKQISEWKQNIEKDPIRQNWANYFKSQTKSDSIFWLKGRGFVDVSSEEITAISFGKINQTDTIFGCGIGVKINNMISSLPELNLYSNPKIFLINSRNHIIPISMDYNKKNEDLAADKLSDPLVVSFLSTWKDLGSDSTSFTLDYNNDIWWGQVIPFEISKSNLKLAVAVSESQLIFAYLFNTYVITAILIIILIIITIVFFRRRAKKIKPGEKLTESELKQLLEEGESKFFELKSSLRWDYREEKVNKKLEEVIIKSISAFNNSEGGYLVIGIDDDKNILGLNNDYASLKKNDADYFELHLRNLIGSAFTVRYSARKININFITIDNKEICVIKIEKGEYPLFLKTTDKNGKQIEKFYVRSGNSSQEIGSLTEINDYIKVRFNSENN